MSTKRAILIIEDDPAISKALHDKFTGEGFKVTDANNGSEGFEKALELHPDIILLDIVMPKMDGITMAKKLKQDEWGSHAEIIILTNVSDPEELAKCFDEGVHDYLIKADWKLEEIVDLVKERLHM